LDCDEDCVDVQDCHECHAFSPDRGGCPMLRHRQN
jgi:hypothetical protein